ncbi:MAG: HEAT repeat domain-containing protein [Candidatus Wallbacteria bacterium]|nr:HEAT repeat domain-containing protein [Candidatus Wallbacteria bacterium]
MAIRSIRDLKIINNLRVEFIRRKIDFTKLRLMCENGYVTIIGQVAFIDGQERSVSKTVQDLDVLDKNLRKLAYIKYVKYYFENWQRDEDGKWHQISEESAAGKIKYWLENLIVKLSEPEFRKNFLESQKETNRLTSFLKSDDVEIRRLTIRAMIEIGDSRFFTHLIDMYSTEKDESILSELILAIGKLGKDDSIHLLKKHLTGDNIEIVLSTIKALGATESKTIVPILLPLLSSAKPEVKAEVVNALAKLGKEEVLHAIEEMLESSNVQMRLMAIEALSKMKSAVASQLLRKAMSDGNSDVRFKAVLVLARLPGSDFTQDFLALLESEKNEYVKATLVKACAKSGGPAVLTAIIPFLSDKDGRVRANSIEAMEKIVTRENRDQIVESVLPCIEDENNRVRVNAINLLAQMGEVRFTDKLFHMLRSPDPVLFSSASYALSVKADALVVRRLFDELMTSPTPVKSVVIDTLKKIEQKVPELVKLQLDVVKKELKEINLLLAKF